MTDLSALNLCYFMPPNTPFICDEREFFTNLDFEQLSSHALYCYVKKIIIRRYVDTARLLAETGKFVLRIFQKFVEMLRCGCLRLSQGLAYLPKGRSSQVFSESFSLSR